MTSRGADHGVQARAQVVQTVWARLLLLGLKRAGVARAVISPGSRSTPFTLAAEHVGLQTQTVIDERSAGFLALGCARALARPVLLICTSGSAGAHYFPALIEASYAHVPLVVLTADRPPELMACAAPQTIDQTRLFGDHVRFFCDLGVPDGAHSRLRALVRKATQAVHHALAPRPGPVHLNAPARKPLEPAEPQGPADVALVERADAISLAFTPQVIAGRATAPAHTIVSLAQACAVSDRSLIVAGPARPDAEDRSGRLLHVVHALARRSGSPVLAESTSQLRLTGGSRQQRSPVIDQIDLLLGQERVRAALAPDLIVQIGAPPTSRHWADFLAQNNDCVHAVIAESGWNDPYASADLLVQADPLDTLERVLEELASALLGSRRASTWLDDWHEASDLAWRAVESVCPESAETSTLSEGEAMRSAVRAIPRGACLLLGNSLPVRTVDTYTRHTDATVRVLAQRGANGIDGFVSAAAGTAWAGVDADAALRRARPTVAIIGDVSFVHDLGGLAAACRTRAPLCIVVMDNRGGRIFDRLPIAADPRVADELYRAHFLTEPGCDMQAAAALFGARYECVDSAEALAKAVAHACDETGCTVIRAVVDPESATRDRARIAAELDRLLTAEWTPTSARRARKP